MNRTSTNNSFWPRRKKKTFKHGIIFRIPSNRHIRGSQVDIRLINGSKLIRLRPEVREGTCSSTNLILPSLVLIKPAHKSPVFDAGQNDLCRRRNVTIYQCHSGYQGSVTLHLQAVGYPYRSPEYSCVSWEWVGLPPRDGLGIFRCHLRSNSSKSPILSVRGTWLARPTQDKTLVSGGAGLKRLRKSVVIFR